MGKLGPIRQLGYAVRDMDAWIEQYLAAGVGPWFIVRDMAPSAYEFRGQMLKPRFNVGISWSAGVQIEIIQPIDEVPNAQSEYLDLGLEGLQHVCYFPDDYEAAKAELGARGYGQYLTGGNAGFAFNYFERRGGVPQAIELGVLSEDMKVIFGKLVALCAAWDGSEPYRGAFRDAVTA